MASISLVRSAGAKDASSEVSMKFHQPATASLALGISPSPAKAEGLTSITTISGRAFAMAGVIRNHCLGPAPLQARLYELIPSGRYSSTILQSMAWPIKCYDLLAGVTTAPETFTPFCRIA